MFGDNLVYFGGAVKALGEGKFSAPLVTFGSPSQVDMVGDYFTGETDFWLDGYPSRLPLLYSHGMDDTVKRRRLGSTGSVKVEKSDLALWIEGQLNLRDEYEASIYALIEQEKMGTSSGSASHLVERKQVGNAFQVLSWPLVEASLTPTPCEPRNTVMPVKSLLGILSGKPSASHAPVAAKDIKTVREFEQFLRDSGISNDAAVAIASKGFKEATATQRDSAAGDTPETSDALGAEIRRYLEIETRYTGVLVTP